MCGQCPDVKDFKVGISMDEMKKVAYFSMEIALNLDMPTYSVS